MLGNMTQKLSAVSFCAAPHGDIDGSGQAAGADPGVHLAQLALLLLTEAWLVFLHAPQRLPVLTQHRVYVPVGETPEKKVLGWIYWLI